MNTVELSCFKPWRQVHWNQDPIIDKLKSMKEVDLDSLSSEELKHLVKELDRRFTQLWDKVVFERQTIGEMMNTNNMVPSDYIDKMLLRIHPKKEDFEEGDILHRVDRFLNYRLGVLTLDRLALDEFDMEEGYIEEIMERIKEGHTIPPIVYDRVDNSIIDGNHRANAYNNLGYTQVFAYIGNDENPVWEYDDD